MPLSNPQIISLIIGVFIAGIIFWLVRKDHLVSKDAIRWLFVAAGVLLFGAFPTVNDWIGARLGVGYPPIIPVLLGFAVVLIKLVIADIQRTQLRADVTRLVQRVALLEHELNEQRGNTSTSSTELPKERS